MGLDIGWPPPTSTFGELSRPEDLRAKCRELADAVAEDLVEHRLQGKCVTVKLKTVDFEVHTRAVTLKRYTDAADEIFAHAWQVRMGVERSVDGASAVLIPARSASAASQQGPAGGFGDPGADHRDRAPLATAVDGPAHDRAAESRRRKREWHRQGKAVVPAHADHTRNSARRTLTK